MAKKTKICYIISDINKAVAFEWIAEELDRQHFELSFILLLPPGSCALEEFLNKNGIRTKRIKLCSKKDFIPAFFSCFRTLLKWNPSVVHCHLRKATLLGLSAAKLLGIQRRIYTRHHATFHHDYFPAAVKWDHLCNTLATDIVAISENVKEVLQELEKVPTEKIHLIHHGFDLTAFADVRENRVEVVRKKYLASTQNQFVVGVIGRYIELKGHEYIVTAAKELLADYPDSLFIFANASGPDEQKIRQLLQESLPARNYVEIKFEEDLFALYQLFDIYIHVPVNEKIEAFGQTYVEALAAGIPSVFTLSGVANEFIEDGKNAIVVPFKDSEAIKRAVLKLMNDEDLRRKIVSNGRESVKKFALQEFIEKLEKMYETP